MYQKKQCQLAWNGQGMGLGGVVGVCAESGGGDVGPQRGQLSPVASPQMVDLEVLHPSERASISRTTHTAGRPFMFWGMFCAALS